MRSHPVSAISWWYFTSIVLLIGSWQLVPSLSQGMLRVCIWGSRMSQSIVNHNFRGTDSLVVKWDGLTGKVWKKKNPFWGQCPVSADPDQICTLWWVVSRKNNVAMDQVKAGTLFEQGTNTRNSQYFLGKCTKGLEIWEGASYLRPKVNEALQCLVQGRSLIHFWLLDSLLEYGHFIRGFWICEGYLSRPQFSLGHTKWILLSNSVHSAWNPGPHQEQTQEENVNKYTENFVEISHFRL